MKKNKLKKQPSLAPFFAYWRGETEERYLRIMRPVARFLAGSAVEPDLMTVVGCLAGALAGWLYAYGMFFWAAWLVSAAGLCGTLGGLIARLTHKQSGRGAFLGDLADRYGDLFLFSGMAYFFASSETLYTFTWNLKIKTSPWPAVWTLLALSGSFLAAHVRARAESLEVECKAGILQRSEQTALLILGSWLSALPRGGLLIFEITLALIAVLSHLTALQRILHVYKRLAARSK